MHPPESRPSGALNSAKGAGRGAGVGGGVAARSMGAASRIESGPFYSGLLCPLGGAQRGGAPLSQAAGVDRPPLPQRARLEQLADTGLVPIHVWSTGAANGSNHSLPTLGEAIVFSLVSVALPSSPLRSRRGKKQESTGGARWQQVSSSYPFQKIDTISLLSSTSSKIVF